ncbi:hypothetical protein BS50DRAFT_412995 [Corynespora cassiicola Philippines]|uniref:Uncharacterized protein n=1 Tax=Corynespora cassiicola Philippines TaxID=1448308 RepID=A0A2T2NLU0_CORCC|nr:hypothetical protein BS50DRAFT_412995 [Corynespora cassiicola Philippines]
MLLSSLTAEDELINTQAPGQPSLRFGSARAPRCGTDLRCMREREEGGRRGKAEVFFPVCCCCCSMFAAGQPIGRLV